MTEPFPYLRWGPVTENSNITFVTDSAVESIVPVQRNPVLTGLQIFESEWHFALPDAKPELILLVKSYVEISVSDLGEVQCAALWRRCKVRLYIDVYTIMDLAEEYDPYPPEIETVVASPRFITLVTP